MSLLPFQFDPTDPRFRIFLGAAVPGGTPVRGTPGGIFTPMPVGALTQSPGPSVGGYNTAPPQSPTTYAPPTGGYIPPGGGSPFPFNLEQGGVGVAAQPGNVWRPQEFERPATPYPGQPQPQQQAQRATSSKSAGVGRGGGVGYIPPFTYEPPEAIGTGSYFPGYTGVRKNQMAQQVMEHMARYGDPASKAALSPNSAFARQYNRGRIGGGGSYSGAGGLAGDYQRAFDEARQENEARYRDILTGRQAAYDRIMGMLQGAGVQEAIDLDRAYDTQSAAMRSSLVGRGLGNSTVLDSALMGNNRQRAEAKGRLNDRLIQQLASADERLTGNLLNFMERRDDTYPDYNQLLQLAQLMGQAGAGQPGGVGGGPAAIPQQVVWPSQMGFVNPLAFGMAVTGMPNMLAGRQMSSGNNSPSAARARQVERINNSPGRARTPEDLGRMSLEELRYLNPGPPKYVPAVPRGGIPVYA